MSKKVDERVVEMRFDNSQFESNVKTSMSTLERLKQALKLPGASKSLEGVSAAAKKVDFSGMSKGIETVNAQFSALQVVGMTALSNITTAAMQAGQNLVKSFTIQPLIDGFHEYETQINAVQTILANTQSKGTTMDDVTAALDELNHYADMTIYNFGEMTKNIGTFTAAGVDLEKSVAAIKGIANLGAMSGSTSAQVSTAMYQLSQALAAGRVSLMDWNSVVNAGMGGEQFQNALKRTAEHFGTDVDGMIEKYGSFRESLTQGGWLTAEVLTETLNQISGAYTEADLIAQGYTEDQAKAIVQMANTATDAATKVKTFTQLMQTLSEAAGSGWAKTWQLIFGDFEEAKGFFTELSDYLGGMINDSSDARNALVEGAFGSKWDDFTAKIEEAGIPLDKFQSKLSEVAAEHNMNLDSMIQEYGSLEQAIAQGGISADMIVETLKRIADASKETGKSTEDLNGKLEKFQSVVDQVWNGDFANGEERMKALADAGYDYAEVQDLVNKAEGGRKLTLEDLSEEQLKAIGYTDQEIESLRKLAEEAEKTGTPMNELIESITRPSGRVLFLESLVNMLKAVLEPLRAVGSAFSQVFSIDSSQLYSAIEALHRFSEAIVADEETLKNITSTFKGLFSIIKIFTTLIGGGFGLAFNILTNILENFDMNILDVTAALGEAIYTFVDFITFGDTMKAVIDGIKSVFEGADGPIKDFFNGFAQLPAVQTALTAISNFIDSVKGYFSELVNMDSPMEAFGKIVDDIKNVFANLSWEDVLSGLSNFGEMIRNAFSEAVAQAQTVGPDIIAGLQNGLSGGIERILSIMRDIGTKILEAIKAVLGIQSPSTEMMEVGRNIIEGLIQGLESLLSDLWEFIKGIGEGIAEVFGNIDWGSILMVAMGAGVIAVFYKIASALSAIASPFEGIGAVLESAGDVLDAFAGTLKSFSLKVKADALKSLAVAIALLVGSIAVLTFLDVGKVWSSVAVIAALAAILGALSVALSKFSADGGVIDAVKISGIMLTVGTSLLMLAAVMKIISTMTWEDMAKAGVGIAGFGAVIAGIVAVTQLGDERDLDQAAKLVGKIGVSLLLMAGVAKLIATMSWGDMAKAGVGLAGLAAVVAGLIAVTKLAGKDIDKVGATIFKISAAILLLGVAAKLISGMSWGDMGKAAVGLAGLTAIVTALIYITKYAGKDVDKIGSTILKISAAMALLAITARLIGGMSWESMGKAAVGLAGLTAIVGALVAITKLASDKELARLGSTLLMMSVSIGILAGVAVLLGMVRTENLVKGIVAVAALSSLMAGLVAVTKFAGDAKDTLIGLSIAIGIMAASLVALSLVDTGKLAGATVALTAVMGMFSLLIKMSESVGKSMGTLIVLTVAVGLLGGILYLLSGLPIESTLSSAVALSALLLALAGACKILDGVGKVSGSAIASMAVLTLVVAGIGAVLGVLGYFNIEPSIQTVAALSTLLLAMSAACLILSNIKTVSPMALAAIGVLTLVVGGLAIILGLMANFNIEPSIETALSLSVLLLAMSAAMVILSVIGAAAVGALAGAAAMVGVIAIIAAAVAAFGAIQQIPGVDWIMNEGATFLQNLGNAIGGFVGGIAGGIMEGVSDSLPQVATNLSDFMTNLQPFISGASSITPEIGTGVQSLAAAILMLTGAGILDAVLQFVTGGDAFSQLGDQLSSLGNAVTSFSNSTAGINAEELSARANATKVLIEALSQIPNTGGILGDLMGGKDYSAFATGLTSIGNAVNSFSTSTAGINTESVTMSANATKSLIEALSQVPNTGGVLGDLIGGKDYSAFATGLTSIGNAVKSFSTSTAGIDPAQVSTSAEATKTLIQALADVPESGGLLDAILGGTDYSGFASGLESIGKAVASYANQVIGIDFGSVSNATNSITQIIDFVKKNADSGDAISQGVDNIKKIDGLGDAVSTYSSKVSGIDSGAIFSSISAIRQLTSLINNLVDLDTSGIATFKAAINELATVNVQGVVDAFANAAAQLSGVGVNLMTNLANGIRAGQGVVTSAVLAVINIILQQIRSRFSMFQNLGRMLMTQLANGIRSGQSLVRSAVTSVVSSAARAIRGYYSSFYSSGLYVAQGFAAGIRNGSFAATIAARAMANAAAAAAKAALDEHSPSKVFYEIGAFAGEGLVNALDDYQRVSYNAGYGVADSAINGLGKSISKIGDILSSDVDMNPTISPVLDLSNVRNSVGDLSNLLNTTGSVGLLGNVNAISRSMNQRIQNGTSFDDVVGAIDKLRRDVGDISQPSYNIGGITYDDGTAVSNAIQDLIRATRLERRS